MSIARAAATGLLAGSLLLALACSSPSPEEQVRELIERAEAAARDRDLGDLGEMVSERYTDAAGNGKRETLSLLRYQFLQHPSIHLLKRVRTVRLTEPGVIEAVVQLAVADVEIADFRELGDIQAELLRFDLVFAEESRGEWRVLEAEWRRVRPVDFL